jgi:transketolase
LLLASESPIKAAIKMTSELNKEVLSKAATEARGLAIDAVHACQSGHLGLPLGCAEIGAVLFGSALVHCPKHPFFI